MIGIATGAAMHFDDNDTSAETYYYKVTAINIITGGECESASAMAVDGIHDYVTVHTDGVAEVESGISVYPNPTHYQVTVEAEGLSHITLINTQGQVVYDASAKGNTMTFSLSDYEEGLYLLRVSTENCVVVRRVSVVR